MDVFGNGDDFKDVKETAARVKLPLIPHGRADTRKSQKGTLCQPFVVRCGRYYNRRGSRDGQIRRVCPSSLNEFFSFSKL